MPNQMKNVFPSYIYIICKMSNFICSSLKILKSILGLCVHE